MPRLAALLVFTTLALDGAAAHAAGLFLPIRGVRTMAMGGAFVAGIDEPSAMWLNPANLAGLKGTRLQADVGFIGTSADFTRAGFEGVNNSASPVVDPSIFVSTDFGLKDFTFAMGFFAPYGSNVRFPYEGPQRYSLISNVGTLAVYAGVAAAWQPHKRLRVGVAFENAFVNARFSKAASGQHILGGVEDKEWDLLAQMKMLSSVNPTVGFGIWANPAFGLELAFSLQSPISVSDEGTLKIRPLLADPNPTFDPTRQEGDRARLSLNLPLIARAGVRWNQNGKWDVEAAITMERWSTMQAVTLTPIDVFLVDYPGLDRYRIKEQVFPKSWKTTVAVSLGASAQVHENVRLRGGYFFEPSAVPDETLSVETVDLDKHGLSLGATFTYKGWAFDLMYAHVFFTSRTVTNSEVKLTNPIDADRVTVVGNGTYGGSHDIFGVGVQYKF